MEVNVFDTAGKVTGRMEFPKLVSGGVPLDEMTASSGLLHEVVRGYLANQRSGTHSALTRSEVQGSGKKPWKQKHTGRARSGTSTSPLWKGGGIIFGPKPRSYRINLPQKKVRAALYQILAAKLRQGVVSVSEKPKLDEAKTKKVAEWLKQRELPQDTLLILKEKDEKLSLASRNLRDFKAIPQKFLHPFHLLAAKKVVFTPEAIEGLKASEAAQPA